MKLYRATYGIQVKRHDLKGRLTIIVREEESLLISSEDKMDAEYMARNEEAKRGKKLVMLKQVRND